MRRKSLPAHKQLLVLLMFLPVLLLGACTDDCETTVTYTVQEPVYMLRTNLKNAVKVSVPQTLEDPGKIYVKGNYLFINEVNKGIHVFDNTNPAAPRSLSFIQVPGNIDMAVKGNTLYADSYIDLVALDISNPMDVKLVKRVENIFPAYGMVVNDTAKVFLSGYVEKTVTQPVSSDCESYYNQGRPVFTHDSGGLINRGSTTGGNPGAAGQGGSMARFTISGDFLYTVSLSDLQVFNISNTSNPQKGNKINMGWGIETIFPYNNKLFIGSATGMHIYDNSNPVNPVHLSTYAHVRSCDPVVVEGDLAWVTLRSGNTCPGVTNQLDVINISNPREPKLLKSYPMQNPHGLGIDQYALFLCEGEFGLKVFEVKDHLKVSENLKKHFKDQHAYDVIPLGNTLLLIGKNGLYQYDYSNIDQMKLISTIPVVRKNI
ncbi:LVIVD repeat-containing protein [Pontibacter locisalis]|uniref:LVIVD repeat-containing protein n=1 Tax=Pontibacter locisalis TaxID=1719035 RepID=A0ABW5IPW7_9BACT